MFSFPCTSNDLHILRKIKFNIPLTNLYIFPPTFFTLYYPIDSIIYCINEQDNLYFSLKLYSDILEKVGQTFHNRFYRINRRYNMSEFNNDQNINNKQPDAQTSNNTQTTFSKRTKPKFPWFK